MEPRKQQAGTTGLKPVKTDAFRLLKAYIVGLGRNSVTWNYELLNFLCSI